MQLHKYETHTHTSEGSKCSRITAEALVAFYKAQGYAGLFITDHFLNGNTTVPQDLSWKERIDLLCLGYEKASAEGKKIGMDVFFGWEYSYHGTDFLTYGLDKAWLLSHPDLLSLTTNDYLDLVRADGGFIVHAHPFREAAYIDMIRLLPRKVDAVEVINGERLDFENDRAAEYAAKYDLLKFAGSDTHSDQPTKLCGIQSTTRFVTVGDMIDAVKGGDVEVF